MQVVPDDCVDQEDDPLCDLQNISKNLSPKVSYILLDLCAMTLGS